MRDSLTRLMANHRDSSKSSARSAPGAFGLLAVLTAAAILIHGYHFGFDDQSAYLPAIKQALDSSLYPFDAAFFLAQSRLSCFTSAIAASIRLTRLPLEWAVFAWHFATVFLILSGCWRIARRCFQTSAAVWGSLALVTTVLTLPVAGTFIVLCEPYLHNRAIAAGFLLFGFADVLDRKLTAAVWFVLAALMHPTFALLGLWHLAVQAWPVPIEKRAALPVAQLSFLVLAAGPVRLFTSWMADPSDPAWRAALSGRGYLFPAQWTWYELFGAFAPLAVLYLYARLAEHHGLATLARICRRLVLSGSIGVAAGLVVGLTPALLPLVPLEPLRTLHLIYLFLALFGGGLCAELLPRPWKLLSAAMLVPLALAMFVAQRAELSASRHIEWPGAASGNDWLQAFAWIRTHTPRDALFAMNPDYLSLPGENEHGFRGLAERGQLAESGKDRAVSRNLPELAWEWRDEVRAQTGIEDFDAAQLGELRARYRVSWLLLRKDGGRAASLEGLDCPYENPSLRVCRAP